MERVPAEVDPPRTPALAKNAKWTPEITDQDIRSLNILIKSGVVTRWEIVREEGLLPFVRMQHFHGDWITLVPVPKERKWHYVTGFDECGMKGRSISAIGRKRLMKLTQMAAEVAGMEVEVVSRGTLQTGQQPLLVLRHPGPQSTRRKAS